MGVISNMFTAIVHVLLVVLDVTMTFLIIRILACWWTHRLIGALDKLGAPLVDEVSARVGVAWMHVFRGHCPSTMSRVNLALAMILVLRWLIVLVTIVLYEAA